MKYEIIGDTVYVTLTKKEDFKNKEPVSIQAKVYKVKDADKDKEICCKTEVFETSGSRWEVAFGFIDETYDNQNYTLSVTASYEEGTSETLNFDLPVYRTFLSELNLINKDGRMLTLQYNPELTSLKRNYAESVTTTLGGEYPIVRRNGHQKHRSFQIGALIAHDELAQTFLTEKGREEIENINASTLDEYSKRAYTERILREEVFAFLYSGEEMLFRSGPEGNMIVVLTGISLTSNKQLDRNIYSFTATATEIMEYTKENWASIHENYFRIIEGK